jgi:hypothetical protein
VWAPCDDRYRVLGRLQNGVLGGIWAEIATGNYETRYGERRFLGFLSFPTVAGAYTPGRSYAE